VWNVLSLYGSGGLLNLIQVTREYEEDLKKVGVRKWRHKSQDREEWRTTLEKAKIYQEM